MRKALRGVTGAVPQTFAAAPAKTYVKFRPTALKPVHPSVAKHTRIPLPNATVHHVKLPTRIEPKRTPHPNAAVGMSKPSKPSKRVAKPIRDGQAMTSAASRPKVRFRVGEVHPR